MSDNGGIVRRLDEMCRLVLPADFRRRMDIRERDLVEIAVNGKELIVRKYEHTCIFCGKEKNLSDFLEKPVCAECREKIAESIRLSGN